MKFNYFPAIAKSDRGFSIAELMIVITIIGVMSAVSLFYLTSHRRLLKPNEQALQVLDIMQEARQRALTQRETIRIEVDLDDNIVRLVDENTTSTKVDAQIRQMSLLPSSEVRVDINPPDNTTKPNAAMELPEAKYKKITTSTNINHKAFILRFKTDGTVIDTDGKPDGATFYLWSPKPNQSNQSEVSLAITIEPSGLIRYWQYDKTSAAPNKWKNL